MPLIDAAMKTPSFAVRLLDARLPDAPAIKSTLIATLASASGSLGASMANWNWTGIIACATALATAVVNIWLVKRRDKREQDDARLRREESNARIAALRERCPT